MHQYRFKRSFSEDATLSSKLFNLLESTFTGIRRTAESARALNAPWEEASTPFACFEGASAIAHVGVLELPMADGCDGTKHDSGRNPCGVYSS